MANTRVGVACLGCCMALALALWGGHVHGDVHVKRPAGRAVSAPVSLNDQVAAALHDAAERTQIAPGELKVTLAEAVTWPDGALGCPQPGMAYTQVLVEGYRIRIVAGDVTLQYHASRRGRVFLCPAARIQEPSARDPRR